MQLIVLPVIFLCCTFTLVTCGKNEGLSTTVFANFWQDFQPALSLEKNCTVVCDGGVSYTKTTYPSAFCKKEAGSRWKNIYTHKSSYTKFFSSGKLKYVVDCAPGTPIPPQKHTVTFFNVTWAAVSYFSRTSDTFTPVKTNGRITRKRTSHSKQLPPEQLLKSLRQIKRGQKKLKVKPVAFMHTSSVGETRWKFLEMLQKDNLVERPSGTERYSPRMFDEAVDLYRPFVMNMAFENHDDPGYVTEKVVNAFLAGCIPIYWGTNEVFKYFNRRAMIVAKDFDTLTQLANHVKQVYSNVTLQEQYLREAPCTPDNFQNLFWWRFG